MYLILAFLFAFLYGVFQVSLTNIYDWHDQAKGGICLTLACAFFFNTPEPCIPAFLIMFFPVYFYLFFCWEAIPEVEGRKIGGEES